MIAPLKHIARALVLTAMFAGVVGASPGDGPIDIQTSGFGEATAVPDHLFIAVTVSPRGDAPPDLKVTQDDLGRVRERLAAAGFAPKRVAIAQLQTQPAIQRLDPRVEALLSAHTFPHVNRTNYDATFGVVMLRFDRPSAGLFDRLSATTLAGVGAWKIRDGIGVDVSGPFYTMDRCDADGLGRKRAIANARAAANELARSLGRDISADAPSATKNIGLVHFNVCGPHAVPAIPIPNTVAGEAFGVPAGMYNTDSTVRVAWRTTTAAGERQSAEVEPDQPDTGTIHMQVTVDGNESMADFYREAGRQLEILRNAIDLKATSLVRISDSLVHGVPVVDFRSNWSRSTKTFGVTYAQADRVVSPSATYVSPATSTIHVVPDRGHFEISFGRSSDSATARAAQSSRIESSLHASGFRLNVDDSEISVDVDAPTRDVAAKIRDAVFVADTTASVTALYYVSDCHVGDERSIVASAQSARADAVAWANDRKEVLGPIVAASLDGIGGPSYCGGFAYGANPLHDDAVDPYVAVTARVRLVYAVTSSPSPSEAAPTSGTTPPL